MINVVPGMVITYGWGLVENRIEYTKGHLQKGKKNHMQVFRKRGDT